MKIARDLLKDIVVEEIRRVGGEVERRQLIEGVEQHLRNAGYWEAEDDLDSESVDRKSKGRAVIDFAISDLKRDRRLENPARNRWRLPEGGSYPSPEDGDIGDGEERGRPAEVVMRAIRARRGQPAFRDALRERYGDRCLITGCPVLDVLEAAHIRPYRTDADNASDNGLLLRADVHTLFDLDLLGIEPESLIIRLHPRAAQPYAALNGQRLAVNGHSLDPTALEQRWALFQARLEKV